MNEQKFDSWVKFLQHEATAICGVLITAFGTFGLTVAQGEAQEWQVIIPTIFGGIGGIASILYNFNLKDTVANIQKKILDIVTTASSILVAVFGVLSLTGAIAMTDKVSAGIITVLGLIATLATEMYEKVKNGDAPAIPAK